MFTPKSLKIAVASLALRHVGGIGRLAHALGLPVSSLLGRIKRSDGPRSTLMLITDIAAKLGIEPSVLLKEAEDIAAEIQKSDDKDAADAASDAADCEVTDA